MDQPGKVANPARGQLNRENDIPLFPCVPENLVSRDGFSRPVPRQPAHLHTQAESSACAGGLSAVNAIGTQLRDPINSGLGTVDLKVVPNGCCLGRSPWTN